MAFVGALRTFGAPAPLTFGVIPGDQSCAALPQSSEPAMYIDATLRISLLLVLVLAYAVLQTVIKERAPNWASWVIFLFTWLIALGTRSQ